MIYAFESVRHRGTHVSCVRMSDTPTFEWEKCPTYYRGEGSETSSKLIEPALSAFFASALG